MPVAGYRAYKTPFARRQAPGSNFGAQHSQALMAIALHSASVEQPWLGALILGESWAAYKVHRSANHKIRAETSNVWSSSVSSKVPQYDPPACLVPSPLLVSCESGKSVDLHGSSPERLTTGLGYPGNLG